MQLAAAHVSEELTSKLRSFHHRVAKQEGNLGKHQSGSSGPGSGVLFFFFGNKDFKAPIMSFVRETNIKLPRKTTVAIRKTVEVSTSSSRFPIINPTMTPPPNRLSIGFNEP